MKTASQWDQPAGYLLADVSSINPAALIELYCSVGWGRTEDYRPANIRALLDMSDYYCTAFSEETLVGFVRVLTDKVMTTWIPEIVVHPMHQRRGVGSALLGRVIKEFGQTAIYVSAFLGTELFFERFAIRARPNKLVAMSRRPGL